MSIIRYVDFLESKKDKFPNIKSIEVDGYSVLIGRDAVSNDHLTTIMAKDDDLWFHAKGIPGSHVIIRQGDRLVTPEVKLKVAKITLSNSKFKQGENLVVCCKAKYVKKDSEMPPGKVRVDYKNAEEIKINI